MALILMAPAAADARWPAHRGWRHHARYLSWDARWRDPEQWRWTCEAALLRQPNGELRRCRAARDAFQRDNPCPSTGLPHGACPGFVVDHVVPLKRGGADDPANMQWETVAEARAKDRIE